MPGGGDAGGEAGGAVGEPGAADRAAAGELDRRRGQFVVGPAHVDGIPGARRVTLGGSLCLTAHPDLGVTMREHAHGALTLIGFALDPRRPEAGDGEILDALLPSLCPPAPARPLGEESFAETWSLGGRWVLIVDRLASSGETALVHDAAGLRQVFHTRERRGDPPAPVWCASQPGLIAAELGFAEDEQARDFIERYAAREAESWWPGTASPFAEIAHLLPNHVLPLDTGRPVRFWPARALAPLAPDEALGPLSAMLRGTMRAAAERFDLVLGMTAGWDSRVALAASREVAGRLRFMTVRQSGMDEGHVDLVVSRRLLEGAGLAHRTVDASGAADAPGTAFLEAFLGNVDRPHRKWAGDVAAISRAFPERPVAVSGGFAEAARNFYGVPSDVADGVDPAHLLAVSFMPAHPFAERHQREWLAGLPRDLGYSVLDLFYWEQRSGNWLAMCQAEFDPAWGDIFTPYNNRELMALFLAVHERYRKGPWFLLHRRLVETLWPALLETPINPPEHPPGSARRALAWLRAFASFHVPEAVKVGSRRVLAGRRRGARSEARR